MRCAHATAAALLLVSTGLASSDAAQIETTGEFLLSIPARTVDPVIAHCSESVPELKDDLENERASFIGKLTAAGKPLMEKLSNDPGFNAPVDEKLRQDMQNVNAHGLSMFKQQDPGPSCRRLLAKIQGATVEELRKVVEDTYQGYLDTAKAKKAE